MATTDCPHLATASLAPPKATQSVYREDCTLCFDSIDSPHGLDVCLHCFNGGCCEPARHHARDHADAAHHPLALNIRRTRKRKLRDTEPPAKISKLAITAETDEDRYDTRTRVRCYECASDHVAVEDEGLRAVVDGVLKANTFARQEEVKAWEQEMIPCEHALCLEQEAPRQIDSGELGHCSMCDLRENLWLCLTCGNLGCGRKQFGSDVGGNSHGVSHTDSTGHPVAVKLGSLTADGNADIYCYACNDEKTDPELVAHLAHWGIDIAARQKTEKSLTEMNIEQNLRWEFNMTTQDGRELKPMFGPGLTGLKNLGNSCYLNSVMQSLFSFPDFASRYYRPSEKLPFTQTPAEDLEIQLRKVADGLLSGRYAKPDSDVVPAGDDYSEHQTYQKGIAPAMLKHLVGRGHSEFSTMRQQDAFEFLLHILKLISRSQNAAKAQYSNITDPVDSLRFVMEQKLQCLNCKKVRYRQDEMENISVAVPVKRIQKDTEMENTTPDPTGNDTKPAAEPGPVQFEPVTLKQCLDEFTAAEVVELECSSCGKSGFTKQSLFKSFPSVLAINARRFELVNWVPTKQDVPVIVDEGSLDFESYRSPGRQADEEELPGDDASAPTAAAWVPNEGALSMLEAMGFPRVRCEKALHATGNQDPEAATGWLFEHMEDADIDDPVDFNASSSSSGAASGGEEVVTEDKLEMLSAMGFSVPQGRQALKETGGDVERAVDWLFNHPEAEGDFGGSDNATQLPSAQEPEPQKEDTRPAKFSLQAIVCHKGASIHAGHYVAFVRKEQANKTTDDSKGAEAKGEWILFNDEKVALGGDAVEMSRFAYVYFFKKD
ncbi:hypothetical protein AAFC00_001652 [Neodothiora populina]|uniref:Ubiquitin carboxyl-terminal hydrolase n=1 Tax=Neodothiora populina TaxID=2781224 RepID=A0ABR3PPY1_9PEZI